MSGSILFNRALYAKINGWKTSVVSRLRIYVGQILTAAYWYRTHNGFIENMVDLWISTRVKMSYVLCTSLQYCNILKRANILRLRQFLWKLYTLKRSWLLVYSLTNLLTYQLELLYQKKKTRYSTQCVVACITPKMFNHF